MYYCGFIANMVDIKVVYMIFFIIHKLLYEWECGSVMIGTAFFEGM